MAQLAVRVDRIFYMGYILEFILRETKKIICH
jgi:hypothetical protein